MQGLQHETVATQRDYDIRVLGARIGMTLAHVGQRLGGIRRRGEMKGWHGAPQPPVIDMGRARAGAAERRSITKS